MNSFSFKLLHPTTSRVTATVVVVVIFFALGLYFALGSSSYASSDRFLHWAYFICFLLLSPGSFLTIFLPKFSFLALPLQVIYCYVIVTIIQHLFQKITKRNV